MQVSSCYPKETKDFAPELYKAPGHTLCCAGSCTASRAGEGSDPSQEQGTGPLSSSFHVSILTNSIAEESPCEYLPSLASCLLRAVRHAACNNRAAPLVLPALQMPGQGPEADAVPAYSGRCGAEFLLAALLSTSTVMQCQIQLHLSCLYISHACPKTCALGGLTHPSCILKAVACIAA